MSMLSEMFRIIWQALTFGTGNVWFAVTFGAGPVLLFIVMFLSGVCPECGADRAVNGWHRDGCSRKGSWNRDATENKEYSDNE